jgi:hypothetical protein
MQGFRPEAGCFSDPDVAYQVGFGALNKALYPSSFDAYARVVQPWCCNHKETRKDTVTPVQSTAPLATRMNSLERGGCRGEEVNALKGPLRRCSRRSSCGHVSTVAFEVLGEGMTYVMYRKPSSSLCSSYMELIKAAVGGSTSSTKMKMAFSGESLIRFLIT